MIIRPLLHDHTTAATRPLLHDHTTTATRPHDRCYELLYILFSVRTNLRLLHGSDLCHVVATQNWYAFLEVTGTKMILAKSRSYVCCVVVNVRWVCHAVVCHSCPCFLGLFNAELSPERYWRGPRSPEAYVSNLMFYAKSTSTVISGAKVGVAT